MPVREVMASSKQTHSAVRINSNPVSQVTPERFSKTLRKYLPSFYASLFRTANAFRVTWCERRSEVSRSSSRIIHRSKLTDKTWEKVMKGRGNKNISDTRLACASHNIQPSKKIRISFKINNSVGGQKAVFY